jgi:hypothetical protein
MPEGRRGGDGLKKVVYVLLLALTFALVLPHSVFAAEQLKLLRIRVVDAETGRGVAGECNISTDTGDFTFYETNAGGQALVTLNADATEAFIGCSTGAGSGFVTVSLRPDGVTRATIVV